MKPSFLNPRKPALLLTLGTAIGLISGGAMAWWFLSRQPATKGLPTGAEVLPRDVIATMTFTTDQRQWRQLQSFGTPATQAAVAQRMTDWRDRLLKANGLSYDRDVEPWLGSEVTVAYLPPPPLPSDPKQPSGENPPMVMVLPIADPVKAQTLMASPKLGTGQDWGDRTYKGVKIREVRQNGELAYGGAVIDNRLILLSDSTKALERVVDAYQSKTTVAGAPGYSQAMNQLLPIPTPFLRLYVNLIGAKSLTLSNRAQPIPPQALSFFQSSQGLAAAATVEPTGVRVQGTAWLPSTSKVRYKVENNAQRVPSLLPKDTILMVSGGNLKQFWQDFTQQEDRASAGLVFNPDSVRTGVGNLTRFNVDKDLIPWMGGEYGMAVIASPNQGSGAAGLLFLVQASDRRAADAAWKRLDEVMKTAYGFQVSGPVGNQSAVTWLSPQTSLSASHGWLDGNMAYLAIGPGVAALVPPTAGQTLADTEQFQTAIASDLTANNGHFYLAPERLTQPNLTLPLPILPPATQGVLQAVQALGVTSAVQDGRTIRFETQVLLHRADQLPQAAPSVPSALPSPTTTPSPLSPLPSPTGAVPASPASP